MTTVDHSTASRTVALNLEELTSRTDRVVLAIPSMFPLAVVAVTHESVSFAHRLHMMVNLCAVCNYELNCDMILPVDGWHESVLFLLLEEKMRQRDVAMLERERSKSMMSFLYVFCQRLL